MDNFGFQSYLIMATVYNENAYLNPVFHGNEKEYNF